MQPGSDESLANDNSRPLVRDTRLAGIVALALALGVSVDLLFYEKAIGASWPIFMIGAAAALLVSSVATGVPIRRTVGLPLVGVLLAVAAFLRANGALMALNALYGVGLFALAAAYWAGDRLSELPLFGYVVVWVRSGLESLIRPLPTLRAALDARALHRADSVSLGPVARGLLLSLPVLVVFCALFAEADLVFAEYLSDVLRLEILPDLVELGFRLVIVLGASWFILGWLSFALRQPRAAESRCREGAAQSAESKLSEAEGAADPAMGSVGAGALRILEAGRILGRTECTVILTAVTTLFGAFVWIQFAYLFGGQENVAAHGFTYSQYARRGFFELLAAAVLALGLVLGLRAVTRFEGAGKRTFSLLGSLVALLVLAMLASALRRLALYESAYGYTQLRLWSHVFMVWLGLSFVWLAISLWLKVDRFAIGAFVCALGFVATLDLVNPDATIARLNLERYQETGKVDIRYLCRLSNDAVPVLVAGLDILEPEAREVLFHELSSRRLRLVSSEYLNQWQSYHLSHRRAYDALVGAGVVGFEAPPLRLTDPSSAVTQGVLPRREP